MNDEQKTDRSLHVPKTNSKSIAGVSKNRVKDFLKTGKKSIVFISFLRPRIFMKNFPSHKYKEGVIFPSRHSNRAIEMEESYFLVPTPLTCTRMLNSLFGV